MQQVKAFLRGCSSVGRAKGRGFEFLHLHKMTIEQEIKDLFTEEKNRKYKKMISGFYLTESEYEGTNIEDEV